ncbi:hypothetical protein AUI06_12640 [archaeon 13_2_20CM_2_52_21]|nr:MAG: hypothetical protein AUI06_12640 [archaeon 13_2_20CM_2_52_21]
MSDIRRRPKRIELSNIEALSSRLSLLSITSAFPTARSILQLNQSLMGLPAADVRGSLTLMRGLMICPFNMQSVMRGDLYSFFES